MSEGTLDIQSCVVKRDCRYKRKCCAHLKARVPVIGVSRVVVVVVGVRENAKYHIIIL